MSGDDGDHMLALKLQYGDDEKLQYGDDDEKIPSHAPTNDAWDEDEPTNIKPHFNYDDMPIRTKRELLIEAVRNGDCEMVMYMIQKHGKVGFDSSLYDAFIERNYENCSQKLHELKINLDKIFTSEPDYATLYYFTHVCIDSKKGRMYWLSDHTILYWKQLYDVLITFLCPDISKLVIKYT